MNRTPVQSWPGHAIYLGQGLVLTAAHVAGRTFWTRPKVVVAGREHSTEIVREGSLEGVDLTLLRVDPRKLPIALALRMNPICEKEPWPGELVAAVRPGKITLSKVLSPFILPANARRFRTIIGDVAATASSGSGVFDLERKCLLGIVSRKISQPGRGTKEARDIATYFVPASEIRNFVPVEHRYWLTK